MGQTDLDEGAVQEDGHGGLVVGLARSTGQAVAYRAQRSGRNAKLNFFFFGQDSRKG